MNIHYIKEKEKNHIRHDKTFKDEDTLKNVLIQILI